MMKTSKPRAIIIKNLRFTEKALMSSLFKILMSKILNIIMMEAVVVCW